MAVGPLLGLYVGNLQALCGLLDHFWGCMLATYRPYDGCWTAFRAVSGQPTGFMRAVGLGNLQAFLRLLDRF